VLVVERHGVGPAEKNTVDNIMMLAQARSCLEQKIIMMETVVEVK
jgi:hypothetical protein